MCDDKKSQTKDSANQEQVESVSENDPRTKSIEFREPGEHVSEVKTELVFSKN